VAGDEGMPERGRIDDGIDWLMTTIIMADEGWVIILR